MAKKKKKKTEEKCESSVDRTTVLRQCDIPNFQDKLIFLKNYVGPTKTNLYARFGLWVTWLKLLFSTFWFKILLSLKLNYETP